MIVKVLNSDFDKNLWNSKANHPLQSWQWGEARKQMGIEVVRIGEYENEKLISVYQLTIHPLPFFAYKVGYIPRSTSPSQIFLEFLLDYGKKNKFIFIKLESDTNNFKFQTLRFGGQISNFKLKESPHPLFPKWTQNIDLSLSEEELLKNMKSKTRYNIRLAQKKEVTVKEVNSNKGFDIFFKLYFDTCKRQKYFGHNQHYHQIVWENLRENISHLLIAYYKETPLAAYELFSFKDKLYYPYGGTSVEYRNFMGANLLMWEAILLGKKLGLKTFDMWGSLPPGNEKESNWSGFTRFKEGYGTKYQEFIGSYDLVCYEGLYKTYNLIYKLRSLFLLFKA